MKRFDVGQDDVVDIVGLWPFRCGTGIGTAVHRLWRMPRFPFFREPNCFERRLKAVVTTAVTDTSCWHGAARIKRSWWPMCLWTQGRKQLGACDRSCFRSILLWACDCKWCLLKPHEAQSHAMAIGHVAVVGNKLAMAWKNPAHNGPGWKLLTVSFWNAKMHSNSVQQCRVNVQSSKQRRRRFVFGGYCGPQIPLIYCLVFITVLHSECGFCVIRWLFRWPSSKNTKLCSPAMQCKLACPNPPGNVRRLERSPWLAKPPRHCPLTISTWPSGND